MNEKERAEHILKTAPFHNIVQIVEVIPLSESSAISGESFLVIGRDQKKFKLRYCTTLKQARNIERNVKLLPHAFPEFLGREGRLLLFIWLDAELATDCLTKPIPLEFFYQIGKIVGEAHELKDIKKGKNPDSFFRSLIKVIKDSEVPEDLVGKIALKYKVV